MTTTKVWAIALLCALVGVGLAVVLGEAVGAAGLTGRLAGWTLLIVPLGLAVNLTARRRREARREDGPDSVEFQAALSARSDAFGDALVLSALVMLALTVAPGPLPMLWSLLLLTALVAAFWVRYVIAMRQMRG